MAPSPPVAPAALLTLAELALRTGAVLDGDGTVTVTHVAPLDAAGPGAIAFLANPRYRHQLATAHAAAVIVAPDMARETALPKLVHENPYATYAKVAALLHPRAVARAGAHPSAVIAADARVAASAAIGAHAVIGAGAVVGERAELGAGCVIGAGAVVGDDVLLHASVTVYDRCVVGPRSIVQSGAVIGADGFGMAEEGGRWLKIPQLGRVVIGADVEIGANTTIDRGALDDTVIEDDVKLDNQIQIGHNCRIGRHTAIAGCVGVAGSTRIGRNCKIAGAAMISGHLEIPDGTVVGAATVILSSIEKPGVYTGAFPVTEHATWKRVAVELRRLGEFARRLRALERRLAPANADKSDAAGRRKEEP
jgi:UDP-3-O-[3-hydroxymyristoyl] glucosamine N-acyltransferase